MSLLYVIDRQQECIFVHLSGSIGDWELGTRAQELWGEPAFDPSFARLIEVSNTLEWRAGTSLLRAIAADVSVKSPTKVALVGQTEGITTIYVESLTGFPARVFDGVHEALEWLCVRLPEPWPPPEHG